MAIAFDGGGYTNLYPQECETIFEIKVELQKKIYRASEGENSEIHPIFSNIINSFKK